MTFDEFLKLEGARLNWYVCRYAKRFQLHGAVLSDLKQEAYLAAFRALAYWKPNNGHKSAFNWCAGPMRRAMEKTVRRDLGLRPFSKKAIRCNSVPYLEGAVAANNGAAIDDCIDLKRALHSEPKSSDVVRFIMVALSPAGATDFAQASGISKQAVSYSARRVRGSLRRKLG